MEFELSDLLFQVLTSCSSIQKLESLGSCENLPILTWTWYNDD